MLRENMALHSAMQKWPTPGFPGQNSGTLIFPLQTFRWSIGVMQEE
jgi:hypothetical protein